MKSAGGSHDADPTHEHIWDAMSALDRATTPLLHGQPVGWDQALAAFVDGFGGLIDEHGPDSVAFLSTGQMTSEEMALLGAVAKVGMGFVHGDGNTRQCMATSVAAHKLSYGFDAPPYTYADLEASDVVVLVGSNLAVAHPILWERLQRNPDRPHVVAIDPRRTETAAGATWHLPIAPKRSWRPWPGAGARCGPPRWRASRRRRSRIWPTSSPRGGP